MRPASNQSNSHQQSFTINSTKNQKHQIETYSTQYEQELQETLEQDDTYKNQTFYQCTGNQQKIWRLFKSLDCSQCGKMYNNKQRKPHIICANNHLLCKSCYSKLRQNSFLCPFCNVRINTKNTSSHESIQLFLKIYNQIFQKQKCLIEEKRKRSYLEFQIPKNLKTIMLLLLLIVTPWIYDLMKLIVCWVVDLEYRFVCFLIDQVSQLLYVVKIIIEDEFYISLYTNQDGDYVYHGDDYLAYNFGTTPSNVSFPFAQGLNIFTQKHKSKLQIYMKIIYIVGYFWSKFIKVCKFCYEGLRIFNYCFHFLILLVGLVQFPFLIPIILFRIEIFFPKKYKYKIGLYLDIVQQQNADEFIEPQQIQKLSKWELYFLLLVRNYIQYVLKMYKSIEVDMKKRCQDLEYKKRMRLLKKNQKQTTNNGKAPKRFTF